MDNYYPVRIDCDGAYPSSEELLDWFQLRPEAFSFGLEEKPLSRQRHLQGLMKPGFHNSSNFSQALRKAFKQRWPIYIGRIGSYSIGSTPIEKIEDTKDIENTMTDDSPSNLITTLQPPVLSRQVSFEGGCVDNVHTVTNTPVENLEGLDQVRYFLGYCFKGCNVVLHELTEFDADSSLKYFRENENQVRSIKDKAKRCSMPRSLYLDLNEYVLRYALEHELILNVSSSSIQHVVGAIIQYYEEHNKSINERIISNYAISIIIKHNQPARQHFIEHLSNHIQFQFEPN